MNLPVEGENCDCAAENNLVCLRTHTSSHLPWCRWNPSRNILSDEVEQVQSRVAGMVRALENVTNRRGFNTFTSSMSGKAPRGAPWSGAQPALLWYFTFCLLSLCWQIRFWLSFQSLHFALDICCSCGTAHVFARACCFWLRNQPRDILPDLSCTTLWICSSDWDTVWAETKWFCHTEWAWCCFLLLPLWKIYESSSERTCATASVPSSRSCPACTLPAILAGFTI